MLLQTAASTYPVLDLHVTEEQWQQIRGSLLVLVLPWPKKRTIFEIRGEKNAVPRVISCSITRDQRRAKVADSRGSDLALAWSLVIEHDITRGTAFFSPRISRMVPFFVQGSSSLHRSALNCGRVTHFKWPTLKQWLIWTGDLLERFCLPCRRIFRESSPLWLFSAFALDDDVLNKGSPIILRAEIVPQWTRCLDWRISSKRSWWTNSKRSVAWAQRMIGRWE